MSFYGSSVEYGLHCLLHLVEPFEQGQPSARELAEFQGLSPSYVAKLFTRLEKAGLVAAGEGIGGGFRLARPPEKVTVLDVVDALEGDKPFFECRDVRDKCILYGRELPQPKRQGICSIHAVMVEAERRMRESLAKTNLAALAAEVRGKSSADNRAVRLQWFRKRIGARQRRADTEKRPRKMKRA